MIAIHKAINEYLAALSVEGKAGCTVEVYGARLRRFANWCADQGKIGPESLYANDLRAYIAHLQAKGNGNGTPRQNAMVTKAFSKWLVAEGELQADPFTSVKLPKPSRRIPEPFSDEEVRLLLKATRQTRNPQRNKVILLVLLDSGLRISELVNLDLERIRFEDGRAMAKVKGKGGKEREVPLGKQVVTALKCYLNGRMRGPVFTNGDGKPLSTRRVEAIIAECARLAGISGKRCSPHIFRHTFAKKYLLNGGDPFSLQQILGHANLETVKLYINLWSTDIQAQHRKFSPADSLLAR
ncbi:MAG TPA: tyrosine-type recombinase/integrase [Dehalococcoidia bacterium]|nr:tyrosine-type recombinase/integrase [Dehalococcoidia bacterium]